MPMIGMWFTEARYGRIKRQCMLCIGFLYGCFAAISSDACGSTHGALYRRAESVRVGHILPKGVYDVLASVCVCL